MPHGINVMLSLSKVSTCTQPGVLLSASTRLNALSFFCFIKSTTRLCNRTLRPKLSCRSNPLPMQCAEQYMVVLANTKGSRLQRRPHCDRLPPVAQLLIMIPAPLASRIVSRSSFTSGSKNIHAFSPNFL